MSNATLKSSLNPVITGVPGNNNILVKLWLGDAGQDLVEYALISFFFGLASYAGFIVLQTTINSSYINWDTGQQGLSVPLDPGGYGS